LFGQGERKMMSIFILPGRRHPSPYFQPGTGRCGFWATFQLSAFLPGQDSYQGEFLPGRRYTMALSLRRHGSQEAPTGRPRRFQHGEECIQRGGKKKRIGTGQKTFIRGFPEGRRGGAVQARPPYWFVNGDPFNGPGMLRGIGSWADVHGPKRLGRHWRVWDRHGSPRQGRRSIQGTRFFTGEGVDALNPAGAARALGRIPARGHRRPPDSGISRKGPRGGRGSFTVYRDLPAGAGLVLKRFQSRWGYRGFSPHLGVDGPLMLVVVVLGARTKTKGVTVNEPLIGRGPSWVVAICYFLFLGGRGSGKGGRGIRSNKGAGSRNRYLFLGIV